MQKSMPGEPDSLQVFKGFHISLVVIQERCSFTSADFVHQVIEIHESGACTGQTAALSPLLLFFSPERLSC